VKESKATEMKPEEMETNNKPDMNQSSEKTPLTEPDDNIEPTDSPENKETLSQIDTEDDPVSLLEKKLQHSENNLNEATDRILRLSAEFDNYKKRMAREMDEFRKFANESLIKQLLNVVDNLERAIESSKSGETANGSIIEGVEMIYKEILSIFEKYHVFPVDCMEKSFDPLFHQAVSQEGSDKHPDNTVIRELMKGYTMHERLIRPSMVTVSKSQPIDKKIDDNNKNEKTINEKA